MTTFYLIRHGHCDETGRVLAGRSPGVHLNQNGRREAEALADLLESSGISAIYSSPLERALETAAPLGRRMGVEVRTEPRLTELDFGAWTGREIGSLDGDTLWTRFNAHRGMSGAPGGELMIEVVARAVRALESIRREWPVEPVAAVSHGDVIRGLLCHAAGIPLDGIHSLEVPPASVSVMAVTETAVSVTSIGGRKFSTPAPILGVTP